jgi:iron complex transport system permease protein
MLTAALAILAMLSIVSLLCGVEYYSLSDLLNQSLTREIVVNLRLPRSLCAIVVGGALAVIGVAYQALFRNYLASPFTLGVSAGAALFALGALVFGLIGDERGGFSLAAFAFLGSSISILIILAVSATLRRSDSNSLLLVGVVYSFFCASLITLVQYLADYSRLFNITRWMIGGIPVASWSDLICGALLCAGLLWWLTRHTRALDLALFGDEVAQVKGVDMARFARITFLVSSLLVGWIVAQCGTIGFVGIIVPAIARLLVGIGHRRVLPMAFILGAILVLVCDILGRVVIAPFEVPAGVFSAVLGGPVFIALLILGGKKGRSL